MSRAASDAEGASPSRFALIGVATWAVAHVVTAVLSTNATGGVVLQALVAELGSGRAGVAWSTRETPTPRTRVLRGFGLGAAFAAVVVALGLASRALARGEGRGAIPAVLLGLVVCAAAAVRDELVLRGVFLRAFGDRLPLPLVLVGAGLTAAVATPTFDATAFFRFAFAMAMVALWRIDGGALLAVAANTAARFVAGPLLFGGIVDLRVVGTGGAAALFTAPTGVFESPASGIVALACAVPLAIRAVRAYRKAGG